MLQWAEATTIGDALVRSAARHPDSTGLVLPPDRFTYRGLCDRVVGTARGLYGLGVRPQDRVGILMPNCTAFVDTFFALNMLGAVAVPINTRYQSAELAHVIDHAGLRAIVSTDGSPEKLDFPDLVRRALAELDVEAASGPALVMLGGAPGDGFVDQERFERFAADVPADLVHECRSRVRIRDTAVMLYTSGTTAKPKGCMLSHEALVRNGAARILERRVDDAPVALWTPCPLFHVGALGPLIGCVATAIPYVTMRQFDAGRALALLESEQITTALPLFPAFTDAMLDHEAFATTDLSRLTQIMSTGTRDTRRRVQESFAPARLVSAFGSTELCGMVSWSPVSETSEDRLDWDGHPFRGMELKIVDPESGSEVPPGTVGEILARGYGMFDGYYRDAKASEAIDADGWFHTGDTGAIDERGRIAFRGRYKDMLKVGGENVGAVEVENFLSGHPGIRHVEVVGAPDQRLDEVVAAFVEAEPGHELTAEDVIGFCRSRIASFKVPRHVWFVESGGWPMSATKVNKVALRERARDELGAQ